MALIIPKNNADAQTLDATLKIYYDANDWVQNSNLIDRLSAALDDLGIEDKKKEPQSYTKKTQVLAYFGFITWQDVTNSQSARRITDLGKKFYEARLTGDTDEIIEVLIESLSTCTFGRNVIGCDSDSDIEAPNVFIKASLLLGGLNNNEFAFILGLMELSGADFSDTVFQIKVNRLRGIKTYPTEDARKWNDPKPITALKNWGFFNSDDNTISDRVLLKYSDALINLKIKNTEKIRFVSKQEDEEDNPEVAPLQQIFYGAPGTGKSHRIKKQLKALNVLEENIFRTTFHPDNDYSTFVGAYKPTMKKQYRYDGKVKAKYYEDDDLADAKKDDIIIDKVIQYDFVPQTFTNAYVAAWKNQDEKVFLIIEEINRGNCAQIFGDLFQLLDRDENGISEYKIKADADIRTYLEDVLGKDSNGIKDGELCLPKNLYIWATMNTSDQSLFPIDSAFKRRWDWEYEPIKYKNTDWVIEIGSNKYSWTSFQKEVNDRIFRDTNSEDKMLGDYFVNVKHKDGIISKELLLNKILFYLWNDVCKDGDGDIFKTEDNKEVKFSELYSDGGTEKLLSMMKQLDVELVVVSDEDVEEDENSKDNTKYSINGSGSYAKRALSTELVKVYISQHPEMSATEVVNKWKSLGKFVSHFIETQDEYDKRTDQNPRVNIIQCNGDKIYVSTNGWGGQGVMDSLIGAIPKDWNLNVEKK